MTNYIPDPGYPALPAWRPLTAIGACLTSFVSLFVPGEITVQTIQIINTGAADMQLSWNGTNTFYTLPAGETFDWAVPDGVLQVDPGFLFVKSGTVNNPYRAVCSTSNRSFPL